MEMKPERLESLRKRYPVGTTVVLEFMSEESNMPCGLKGEVLFIDSLGSIHTKWENGSTLALDPSKDSFIKSTQPEQIEGMQIGSI